MRRAGWEIIYNLLDNAVKYSQSSGVITLRAAVEGDRVRISVPMKALEFARTITHLQAFLSCLAKHGAPKAFGELDWAFRS